MKHLVFVLASVGALVGACELKPSPDRGAAPAAAAPATAPGAVAQPPAPPAPPPVVVPADAAPPSPPPADARMEVSQPCVDVSAHIADVLLASATDPAQKAAIEQGRTRIIRRSAEACTRDAWKPEVFACFTKATTDDQMRECGKDVKSP